MAAREEMPGGHQEVLDGPQTYRTMSELYSHLFEEVELRLAESAQVGVGFDIPAHIAPIAPNCSKGSVLSDVPVNM